VDTPLGGALYHLHAIRESPQSPEGTHRMAAPRPRCRIDGVSSHHAMSHADAAWLRMDRPTNLMVINALLWFDQAPD